MTNISSGAPVNPPETIVELGRLNNLSDCIFAFALTLLVLDIRLPDGTSPHDLAGQLIALAPKLLIYLISFIVIGGAWGSHQRMLSQIKRGDGLLVWFNLLSLLFVTFLPASATLLGQFPGEFIAVLCFAADVILIQLSALWLWKHANKNGLINPAMDPRVVVGVGRRLSLSALAFTISVGLALINTPLVYVVWIGLFTVMFATDWLSWDQTLKRTQAAIALNGAARGQLEVIHSVGQLNIVTGTAENVLTEGVFGGGLDAHIDHNGDLLKARLVVPKQLGFMNFRYPWAWAHASTLDWNLSLNPQIPLALTIETGADLVALVLTEARITDLGLKASGSTIDLQLPANAGQTSVRIQAKSSSLTIHVPTGVAARIEAINAMSNVEVDEKRFLAVEGKKAYASSNYEWAVNRIEIQVDQTLSFVKLV